MLGGLLMSVVVLLMFEVNIFESRNGIGFIFIFLVIYRSIGVRRRIVVMLLRNVLMMVVIIENRRRIFIGFFFESLVVFMVMYLNSLFFLVMFMMIIIFVRRSIVLRLRYFGIFFYGIILIRSISDVLIIVVIVW